MPYERTEYPSWSWSHSRREMFQECPRKYGYQYYASHNGWEDEAPEFARSAYRLKQLTSLPLEIGGAVHAAAAFAIQSARSGGGVPSLDTLRTQVRNTLNRAYTESKDRAEWERWPNRRKMFHEFYYDTGLSDTAIDESKQRIEACLTNLVASESYREAIAAPFVEVKEVENFVTFDLEGTPIHGVPDLLYRLGDDTWTVTDWKSGRESRDPDQLDQLAVYALYLRDRHNVESSNMRVRIEWLESGNATDHTFSDGDLDASRSQILDSMALMQQYLTDPAANSPRDQAAFPLRDDLSMCRYCKFYELDQAEIALQSPGPF